VWTSCASGASSGSALARTACKPGAARRVRSLRATPVRATAHAYDRNLVCNGQPNEAACVRDKRNRCFFWSKSCVGMDAYEVRAVRGAAAAAAQLVGALCCSRAARRQRVDAQMDGPHTRA
jgi:hypothetical protein